MPNPLVSISCITFNHGSYIKECLDGFLMQETSFDFEILINDDASTDNTAEIIKSYQDKYPDLIKPIFQKENQYSKGQRGINVKYNFPRAQGKYIAMCEGDDYWTDPKKLQKQVDFLENNPDYSACFTNATKLYEEDGETEFFLKSNKNRTYPIDEVITKGGGFFPTATLVFKNLFSAYPDFIFKAKSGDRALSLLLANKGGFYFLNENTSIYRVHNQGVFSQVLSNRKERNLISLNNIYLLEEFNRYSNKKYDANIVRAISSLSKKILLKQSIKESLRNGVFKNLTLRDKISYLKNRILK